MHRESQHYRHWWLIETTCESTDKLAIRNSQDPVWFQRNFAASHFTFKGNICITSLTKRFFKGRTAPVLVLVHSHAKCVMSMVWQVKKSWIPCQVLGTPNGTGRANGWFLLSTSLFSKPPRFWHLKFWCICEIFSSTGAAKCHFIELFRCLCLKLKNSQFLMNRQPSLLSLSGHKSKVIFSRHQSAVTNFGLLMFSVGHLNVPSWF